MERRKIRRREAERKTEKERGGSQSRLFLFWVALRRPEAGFRKPALQLRYFDEDGLAFAFAALGEPGGEAFGETFTGKAKAGFDASVGNGEGVVEIGGVGEIAHAELVEPVERARLFLAVDDDVDGELLRVHTSILAGQRGKVRSVQSGRTQPGVATLPGATCVGLEHLID